MIEIVLQGISKKYGFQTIIKDINLIINSSKTIGIAGRNGSGKSTLLSIISSYLTPSMGSISYHHSHEGVLPNQKIFNRVAISAPSVQVTPDMTLSELHKFHTTFKPFNEPVHYQELVNILELKDPKDKLIKSFSSGMRQKVNLAFAILSCSDLLLLDEPTSFLDQEAKIWFRKLLIKYENNRTIVIASNDEFDFHTTSQLYKIEAKTISVASSY